MFSRRALWSRHQFEALSRYCLVRLPLTNPEWALSTLSGINKELAEQKGIVIAATERDKKIDAINEPKTRRKHRQHQQDASHTFAGILAFRLWASSFLGINLESSSPN